jgi:cellulase
MIPSALFLTVVAAATLFSPVTAHGFVKGVNINSKFTNGSDPNWYYYQAGTSPVTAGWDALNQDIGYVEPAAFGTADINCHKSATAGKAYVSANAGDSVQFVWFTWPDSHKGPIINYIAPCNGNSSSDNDTFHEYPLDS